MGTPIDTGDLLRRIEDLERHVGVPRPTFTPGPQPSFTPVRVTCPRCGMSWDSAMGYVCGAMDCPTQPHVT